MHDPTRYTSDSLTALPKRGIIMGVVSRNDGQEHSTTKYTKITKKGLWQNKKATVLYLLSCASSLLNLQPLVSITAGKSSGVGGSLLVFSRYFGFVSYTFPLIELLNLSTGF
jgi:hypothetical protein